MFHKAMRAALCLLCVRSGAAFFGPSARLMSSRSRVALAAEGKINNLVELSSPKVATSMELKAGEKKVFCRCWKSQKFPLCDGAHTKHNEQCGDNVGPLIVTVAKE